MSKTNHTPGPWAVDNRPNQPANSRLFVVNPADTKMPVACLPWCSAEDWANAQLLAAAPDLLAALENQEMLATQATLAVDIGKESQRKRVEFLLSQLKQMREAARAAINKATQPA